ncbi:MAG: hypothetical protein AAF217_11525 [Pseudomonadota bacterium]
MVDDKAWYESRTIWGALIAVAASVFDAAGLTMDAGAQAQLSEAMVQFVGAAGAIVAVYGRISATRMIS